MDLPIEELRGFFGNDHDFFPKDEKTFRKHMEWFRQLVQNVEQK